MTGSITEVRGSEVRCSGAPSAPHPDEIVPLPAGKTCACPVCGRLFRRETLWERITGANWPLPR